MPEEDSEDDTPAFAPSASRGSIRGVGRGRGRGAGRGRGGGRASLGDGAASSAASGAASGAAFGTESGAAAGASGAGAGMEAGGFGAGYCRKEKSLGLLCDNFLRYCRSQRDGVVSLDAAATALSVERRRIYDVTNILEALDIVSRRTKNQYTWHGTAYLHATIARLRESALYDAGRRGETLTEDDLLEAPGDPAHWFFGTLNRVASPSELATLRATGAETDGALRMRNLCPGDIALGMGDPTLRVSLGDPDAPDAAIIGLELAEPAFSYALGNYLSVPPAWLEPLVPPPEVRAGGAGSGVAAITAAREALGVSTMASSVPTPVVPAVEPTATHDGSPAVTVEVTSRMAATALMCTHSNYSLRVTPPLPEPYASALVLPLGASWSVDITDVECALEEEPFPFRLRSLPLLSELLIAWEANAGDIFGGVPRALHASAAASRVSMGATCDEKRPRRDRSLGVLTQRFIKVFLLDRKVVTLDFATPFVIPDDDDEEDGFEALRAELSGAAAPPPRIAAPAPRAQPHRALTARGEPTEPAEPAEVSANTIADAAHKLKARRLYDIANVLCAVRLIDRVHVRGRVVKKPAFRWRGPAYVEPVLGVPLPDWAVMKDCPPQSSFLGAARRPALVQDESETAAIARRGRGGRGRGGRGRGRGRGGRGGAASADGERATFDAYAGDSSIGTAGVGAVVGLSVPPPAIVSAATAGGGPRVGAVAGAGVGAGSAAVARATRGSGAAERAARGAARGFEASGLLINFAGPSRPVFGNSGDSSCDEEADADAPAVVPSVISHLLNNGDSPVVQGGATPLTALGLRSVSRAAMSAAAHASWTVRTTAAPVNRVSGPDFGYAPTPAPNHMRPSAGFWLPSALAGPAQSTNPLGFFSAAPGGGDGMALSAFSMSVSRTTGGVAAGTALRAGPRLSGVGGAATGRGAYSSTSPLALMASIAAEVSAPFVAPGNVVSAPVVATDADVIVRPAGKRLRRLTGAEEDLPRPSFDIGLVTERAPLADAVFIPARSPSDQTDPPPALSNLTPVPNGPRPLSSLSLASFNARAHATGSTVMCSGAGAGAGGPPSTGMLPGTQDAVDAGVASASLPARCFSAFSGAGGSPTGISASPPVGIIVPPRLGHSAKRERQLLSPGFEII